MNRTTIWMAVLVCAASGCHGNADVEQAPADDRPVQHSSISAKPPKGCGSGFWSVHYDNGYKTLREAEQFKPQSGESYVSELSDRRNEYLLAGISANERKEWLSSHKIGEKDQQCIVPLFDEIAAAAKRTLPNYRPLGFTHHDSDEEALIRNAVKQEMPDAEVLAVGVKSPTWEIEKLRNGTPSQRYKYGMAWVKSSKLDDGYCRILYVNIVQDYSGGGTYAETQANYISMEPAGCK